jgi:hypothetical protein
MRPISAESVEQTAQRIENFSVRQGEQLTRRLMEEQPLIMAYLMAVDNDLLNEEEREWLFFLGTAVWQMMTQGDAPLPQVTEQTVEQVEAANQQAFEALADESDEAARTAMEKLLCDYNQPGVLKYVITALMESAQEEGVRQDNLGVLMLDLKTVIDCLDCKLEIGG